MEKLDLEAQLKAVEKEFSIGGGGTFKFEEGENRLRILDLYLLKPIATHFINKKPFTCYGEDEGCSYHGENAPLDEEGNPRQPSMKFLAYVLAEENERVQIARITYGVVKEIVRLKSDNEWSFDNFPMPYDLKILYNPKFAGSLMYKVIPSPRLTPIEPDILEQLNKKKPLAEVLEDWKEAAKNEA